MIHKLIARYCQLLTLITVITTPLMIVGTWYGMNFAGMLMSNGHG